MALLTEVDGVLDLDEARAALIEIVVAHGGAASLDVGARGSRAGL